MRRTGEQGRDCERQTTYCSKAWMYAGFVHLPSQIGSTRKMLGISEKNDNADCFYVIVGFLLAWALQKYILASKNVLDMVKFISYSISRYFYSFPENNA